ncbi:MAG: hypothetical protein IPF99_43505 [Deltaproteobacteria bacterium]|nr:hypothetical protein [Deltaproteobacteria bacterium]
MVLSVAMGGGRKEAGALGEEMASARASLRSKELAGEACGGRQRRRCHEQDDGETRNAPAPPAW